LYIDGGIYNNVPYSSLPKGYKKVLIIDPGLYTDKQNISKSAMNITYESIKAMQYKLVEKELEKINQNKKLKKVFIRPNLNGFALFEGQKNYSKIIDIGYKAAKSRGKEIISLFR